MQPGTFELLILVFIF